MRLLKLFIVCCFLFSFSVSAENEENTYQNPIISGFNPDPSICRVGNDYYLVTSTFEYFPGVPIYHSTDLVNWNMIGHVLSRPSQLNLDSIACCNGIYAPTIRYNKGIYYMITTFVGNKNKSGNFIVTATNPAGPWSDPHWIANAPGIDPSLFFDDDGKVYYSGNCLPKVKVWDKHRNIWIQEINLKTWKLVGNRFEVLDGGEYYTNGKLGSVSNYEGSHLYKKDGKYYLMISHGGTSQNHAVSIWKSDNIFGPYQINPDNPILTHRNFPRDTTFTSTGHADLVQTQNGEWWMVYLAKRPYGGENHILGRETFMSPVDWSGVWPIVNPNGNRGHGELVHIKPNLPEWETKIKAQRDNFKADTLSNEWTFIRTPRVLWYSLSERKGFLRIYLRPEMISQTVNPSFVGKRQKDIICTATTKLKFKPIAPNEEAGLVVERDKDNYYRFTVSYENKTKIVQLYKRTSAKNYDEYIAKMPINKDNISLQIKAIGTDYFFLYQEEGKNWRILAQNIDSHFLGEANAGRFTGTFIGLYASSNGKPSIGFADFDWFEYDNN